MPCRLDLPLPQQPLIQGDERCHAIAAASILAKVYRDQMMREWDKFYPEYGLASHKGYHAPGTHCSNSNGSAPRPCTASVLNRCAGMRFIRRSARDRQMEMFAAV